MLAEDDIDTVKDLKTLSDAVWNGLKMSALVRSVLDQIRTGKFSDSNGKSSHSNGNGVTESNGVKEDLSASLTVYVGDLPENDDEDKAKEELVAFFTSNGLPPKTCEGFGKKKTKKKGLLFAFIEFETMEQLQQALALNGTEYQGKAIKIDQARPRTPREPTPKKSKKKSTKTSTSLTLKEADTSEYPEGWEKGTQVELHFAISTFFVAKLIGKAASNIKKMNKQCGCKILFGEHLPPSQDLGPLQHCAVKGSLEQVEKGIAKMASEMLEYDLFKHASEAAKRGEITMAMLVGADRVAAIIGKKGAKIKQVQKKSEAKLTLLEDDLFGERLLVVGGQIPNVARACCLVAKGLPLECWQPVRCVPNVNTDGPKRKFAGAAPGSFQTYDVNSSYEAGPAYKRARPDPYDSYGGYGGMKGGKGGMKGSKGKGGKGGKGNRAPFGAPAFSGW